MQFRSAYFNARFVIKAQEILRDQYGRQVQSIPGLEASFQGPGRMFDSVLSQARHGWSDEERLQVERYLLAHPWFNVMHVFDQGGTQDQQLGNVALPHLGLAPGQLIPEEHTEFVKQLPWFQAKQQTSQSAVLEGGDVTAKCAAMLDTPEGQINCPRAAEAGHQYCLLHEPDLAEVEA